MRTASPLCSRTCPTTGWSTTSIPRWWTKRPTTPLAVRCPLTPKTRSMPRPWGLCSGPVFCVPCTMLVRAHGLVESPGSIPTMKTGSWLSGAFLLMRSCHSGRTLTTPSWTLLSMSMWCRNTMRPNMPRMWSRLRSCTAAVWTVSSARMTACWSRTALPTPAPISSPGRTMKPAKWRATTGSASRWCALRAPTMKSHSSPRSSASRMPTTTS